MQIHSGGRPNSPEARIAGWPGAHGRCLVPAALLLAACHAGDMDPSWKLELRGVPLRSICTTPNDSKPCPLQNVRAVIPASAGKTLILQGPTDLILLDSTGHSTRVGRAGDGPGEFRFIASIDVDERGTISTFDVRRFALSRFDDRGAYIMEERIAPSEALADAAVVGRRLLYVDIPGAGLGDSVDAVVTWRDSTGGAARRPLHFRTAAIRQKGSDLVPLPVPLTSKLTWSSNSRGEVALTNGRHYDIAWFDSTGTARPRVARRVPPVPITQEERDSTMRRLLQPGGRPSRAGSYSDQAKDAQRRMPSTHPAIVALRLSSSGELWVQRGGVVQDSVLWDRFEPSGSYGGTLALARGVQLLWAHADTVVLVQNSRAHGDVIRWMMVQMSAQRSPRP